MRWKYNPLILWRISAGQLGLHVTIPLSLFFKNYSKIFIQTDNCVFCSDEKKRKIIEKWRIHIQIASRGKSCHSASTNVREKRVGVKWCLVPTDIWLQFFLQYFLISLKDRNYETELSGHYIRHESRKRFLSQPWEFLPQAFKWNC